MTFDFQSRNLNALRGTEAGLIMGSYRSLSHVKDEETRSSFLSLPHTFTSVRRGASFACFFSHSLPIAGKGGGILVGRAESHQYLIGEREPGSPLLYFIIPS